MYLNRGGADVKAEVLKTLNWVKEKLSNSTGLSAYPIGSIYMSVNRTSPSDLFGGTWEALEQGRVLIGQGASYPAGSTGGEATHVLSLNEMPSHNHGGTFIGSGTTSSSGNHTHTRGSMNITGSVALLGIEVKGTSGAFYNNGGGEWRGDNIHINCNNNVGFDASRNWSGSTSQNGNHTHTFSVSGNINSQGSNAAHNNMQPYLAVYMWKRTA